MKTGLLTIFAVVISAVQHFMAGNLYASETSTPEHGCGCCRGRPGRMPSRQPSRGAP